MEKIRPLPPKEWGVRLAASHFFLRLGSWELLALGTLEPAFGGKRRRAFAGWSVQPKGLVRWHQPI